MAGGNRVISRHLCRVRGRCSVVMGRGVGLQRAMEVRGEGKNGGRERAHVNMTFSDLRVFALLALFFTLLFARACGSWWKLTAQHSASIHFSVCTVS